MPSHATDSTLPVQAKKRRKQISTRTRFEVFKRDNFCCAYCGRTPPNVLLVVDHVHPVSKGGTSEMDNLITSCVECNQGKSDIGLAVIAPFGDLRAKAAEIAEREAQLAAYHEVLMASRDREEEQAWAVASMWIDRYGEDGIPRRYLISIKTFLRRLPAVHVLESMELATAKLGYKRQAFKYFCGICWNRIRAQGPTP